MANLRIFLPARALRRVAFLAVLLGVTGAAAGPSLQLPLTPPLPDMPTVATVAELQALGTPGVLDTTVFVQNYAKPNDNGGGVFTWYPGMTAAANPCTTFAATGVASGRWRRTVAGTSLAVDMCGTGTADDSGAIAAAFALCNAGFTEFTFSAKHYKIGHNLSMPPACGVAGTGTGTVLDFTNDADGGACVTIAGTTFGSFVSGNDVGGFAVIGNAAGVGMNAHCSQGIYVSRVAQEHLHDIVLSYFAGPCLMWGQTVLSTIAQLSTAGCGSPTTAEIEIYGEVDATGAEFDGTTLFVTNLNTEADYGNKAQAGVKIDRWALIQINGGSFENAGVPLMVGSKPSAKASVGMLTVSGIDLEDPSNGASSCATFGTGWTGTAGQGVIDSVFRDNTCVADATPITSQIVFRNTSNMYVTNTSFQAPNAGTTVLDFQGTGNYHENAFLNDISGVPPPMPAYVKINGMLVADANPLLAWSVDLEPVAVAHLPLCGAATVGRSRYVTDSTQALTAGIGAVVAGGGANVVRVGCDGKSWRIGG